VIEALLVIDGTPQELAQSVREDMSTAEIKAYLRSKTAEEFFAALSALDGNPDIFNDGAVIRAEGADAFDDPAQYNQVPVIIGSTSEEAKLFMFISGLHERWNNILYQRFAKKGSQVARIAGLDSLAQKMSVHESQPGVYSYIFLYGEYRRCGYNAWPTDTGPTDKMSWAIALGSFHALDIPFNFGMVGSFPLLGGINDLLFREDNRLGQEALSNAMMAYTAQFARTGNPNAAGLPEWKQWQSRKRSRAAKFILFDASDTEAIIQMSPDVR
jgi:para-nitrobenzyl esterase